MHAELSRDYRFESARRLPYIGADHPCAQVHGHSFRVRVAVAGPVVEPHGWVMDFAVIDAAMAPVLTELDHRLLNEVPGLDNPTTEHIARWIWDRIAGAITAAGPALQSVRVAETDASSVTYRGA